jgi:hypothetical protein
VEDKEESIANNSLFQSAVKTNRIKKLLGDNKRI